MISTINYLEHIEASLNNWLPEIVEAPGILHEAMRYAVFSPGKRLRPQLVLATCETLQGDPLQALAPAAAIEMIHAYSLVHDDLPAMDDDDLRRGRPTTHKVFGEDVAILAGDALLTQAFTVVAEHSPDPTWVADLVSVIAKQSGWFGMVGGQIADIKSTDKDGSLDLIKFIHNRKTAALISACLECGAICANASEKTRLRYRKLGQTLGLAFQIVDDILDCTETTEKLGKTAGKDVDQNKMTYPSVVGLERAQKIAEALKQEVFDSLESEQENAAPLIELIDKCVHRDH